MFVTPKTETLTHWKNIINILLHTNSNRSKNLSAHLNTHWLFIAILTLLWKATASKSSSVQRCFCQTPPNIHSLSLHGAFLISCNFPANKDIFTRHFEKVSNRLRATYWVPLLQFLRINSFYLKRKERLFQLQMRGLWVCPTLLSVPWYRDTPGSQGQCSLIHINQGWNDTDRILVMSLLPLIKWRLWSHIQWWIL